MTPDPDHTIFRIGGFEISPKNLRMYRISTIFMQLLYATTTNQKYAANY